MPSSPSLDIEGKNLPVAYDKDENASAGDYSRDLNDLVEFESKLPVKRFGAIIPRRYRPTHAPTSKFTKTTSGKVSLIPFVPRLVIPSRYYIFATRLSA